MSVIQLLCIRCSGSGSWLHSVANTKNTISTLSRNVLPVVNSAQFPFCENKSLDSYVRIRQLKDTQNSFSKEELLNEKHWSSQYLENFSKQRIGSIDITNPLVKAKHNKLNSECLPIGHTLFFDISDSQINCHGGTHSTKVINNFSRSSEKNNTDKSTEDSDNDLPTEETLEKAAAVLVRVLTAIFVKQHDYRIYRHDILFENRIKNKVFFYKYANLN